ncbi:espin-like [Acanthaster planci]|uniref:Espin-like n=1 Tax=Acanthaster planci TaxID=133434 RepID=A0A8B7YUP1_ACAPL|nr:espin-like [Acanthaster planci]
MNTDQILLAVRTGQLAAVKRAMARGELDRNLRDPHGATCLHLAARSGSLDLVKFLVEVAGHSTIATAHNGALPSHDAAAAGHQSCLDYLLRWGCPDGARDHSGATVLHISARFGHLSLLRFLVEVRGLNIRDKDKKGVSVLHYATARGDISSVMYITSVVPDMVNERTESGTTPAYFAVQNGHLSCLQYLVTAAGANVHLRANDGMQPVHAAAQTGKLRCLIWLVQDQGVLPMERDNDGATPLHFAASRGHAGIVSWLLENGATCERDHLGGTPLHDAAEHGQLECAKILVEHGCNVNTEDKDFLVASDLAKKCGHFQVAKFLRSVEKRTGKTKGKGQSGCQSLSDHEAGVYIKHNVSSSSNTSSLSSSIMSDHDSSSSAGTIEKEFIHRSGRYEVTESPEPDPDPQYVQIYEKLTEVDPTFQMNGFPSPRKRGTSGEGKGRNILSEAGILKKGAEFCSKGTQTDCPEPLVEDGVESKNSSLKSGHQAVITSPALSPERSLHQQSTTEEHVNSSPGDAPLARDDDAQSSPPLKLSLEKKELRFSTTVMVEEIVQPDEGSLVSPAKRNIHLIPLNRSSETRLQSPPPKNPSQGDHTPSPPSITNSPPPHLPMVTPNRPTAIVIPPPPMMVSQPTSLQSGRDQPNNSGEVSSRLSFITSAIPTPPSPPPPPAPPPTNSQPQHSPTTSLSLHSSPSVPGFPSPRDLASVVLKPSPQNSRRSSNSSLGSKQGGINADLIAEIQAGAMLRQSRKTQSMFLQTNKDPSSRSPSPVQDRGPKVFYAADFLDSIPLVAENGAELPDWRRRFLAKKEADRANQRAAEEYKREKQQRAEERKYRDMPTWKVELLKKIEARANSDKPGPTATTSPA